MDIWRFGLIIERVSQAVKLFNPKALQIKMASVAIMICGNQGKEKFKVQWYWQLNGSCAAESILIAANAVGLGAVWTAIFPYQDRIAAVKKLLNLPEEVIPLNIIPIGYPAEKNSWKVTTRPCCTHSVGKSSSLMARRRKPSHVQRELSRG